jgi:hypothetical protein
MDSTPNPGMTTRQARVTVAFLAVIALFLAAVVVLLTQAVTDAQASPTGITVQDAGRTWAKCPAPTTQDVGRTWA